MAKDETGFSEIEEYTKKLNQNPESLVFVPLAEAYRKSGMLDEAIQACQKGLQVHPGYMSARMVLGRAFLEKEMNEEAAGEFRKVAAADVNNIMAHSLLGQVFFKQGKFTQAIESFQRVLTLNPEDATAQQFLKQALEQTKNPSAKPEPKTAVAAKPDINKELTQAEELTRQGDLDNAIKIYRFILESDPENLVVRQKLKDLEQKKAQGSAGRKGPEKKTDAPAGHRDNDKITSDDILSVMRDTLPRAPQAPKPAAKEPPAPESKPAPPVAPAGLSAEITEALDRLLQAPGIAGTLLIDEKGQILHTSFPQQAHLQEMSQAAFIILEKTEKAVRAMDYGSQIRQILINGEKGQLFFNKFGSRILMVQADENINIGKLRLALGDVNKVLR